jgi:hypothetical protein
MQRINQLLYSPGKQARIIVDKQDPGLWVGSRAVFKPPIDASCESQVGFARYQVELGVATEGFLNSTRRNPLIGGVIPNDNVPQPFT